MTSQTRNAKERFDESVVRVLNKIKRPSTAEEITELLNQELNQGDQPFTTEEVETWLRDSSKKVVQLYWLAIRTRK